MTLWRVTQRLGAAAAYSEGLSRYHADRRSQGPSTAQAPAAVVLAVDACSLGRQVRSRRRPRQEGENLPPLTAIQDGHFQNVKPGVWLLPSERVETSPGRHSVVRRFLVSCLGDADDLRWPVCATTRVGVVRPTDRGRSNWRRCSMDLEARQDVCAPL